MIPIGWFGVGFRRARRRRGRGRGRTHCRALGYDSVWVGEHPVLIDPHVPPSPLPPDVRDDGPGAGPRVRGGGDVAHHARHRHRASCRCATRSSWPRSWRRSTCSRRVASSSASAWATCPASTRRSACRSTRRGRTRRRVDRRPAHAVARRPARAPRRRSRRSVGSSAALAPCSPGGPPIIGQRHCRPPPVVGRSSGAKAGTASSRISRTPRPRSQDLARLADEVDRPAELGELEIIISPLPGPIDTDTVRRYEDLGVDRLALVQDFGDMAGGPDPARRGKFLDEMAACAERLDIR